MKALMTRRALIGAMLAISATLGAAAQAFDDSTVYFQAEEMPDMLKWLPAPPDATSPEFMRDVNRYMWGKEQRNDSVRAALAIAQADYTMGEVCRQFSGPMGITLSQEATPEIFRLLNDAIRTADKIVTIPKAHYKRPRPFMVFHEHTLTPDDEVFLVNNGSYPSGHTLMGITAALTLLEINPEAADALMQRGYEIGDSRVIVGAHWQSDVDAGRQAAAVAMAKIHTSPEFQKQLEKAKKEFARVKNAQNK